MPTIRRVLGGSESRSSEISTDQIGIVYAMIALRPAGSCSTPNSTRPFQSPMLKSASTNTLPQSARGTLVDSPERRATARRPSAANGSVIVRNVSGGISDTPIFSTGQLQPQISVSTATGRSDDALIDDVTDGLPALIVALRVAAAALRRTCSGAMRGPGSPSRRAGCGPGTRGAWR